MREFIYYSKSAVTAGNYIKSDLMKAGRLDIACNVIIQAFFISNSMRKDVRLHMIFDGPPVAPVHLVFEYDKDMPISKKDIAGLIKRMLYKCPKKKGKMIKVFPGCYVEKKGFEDLVLEMNDNNKNVFVLDKKGVQLREMKLNGNELFIIGDQDGFSSELKKFIKKIDPISVSPKMLFASQVFVIIHNELDMRNI